MVNYHSVVVAAKRLVYGKRGEPYAIAGQTLRFVPGTRPTRLKYATAEEWVSRYDALEMLTLLKAVKPGDTIFDIGAHSGQYSVVLSALCGPTGSIVAFEPDPAAREVLHRNIALNPQVKPPKVEALAVSDTTGEAILFCKGGNAQSSLARSGVDYQNLGGVEEVSVKTVTLDDYGMSPQWVKIDTEGAEIAILRGARKLLAGDTSFLVELHPYAWPEFGVTFEDLQAVVAESGRRMRYLDRDEPLTQDPVYGIVILERL